MNRIHTRIIQVVPLSSPLWALYSLDEPSMDGWFFFLEEVICLALVEEWEVDAYEGSTPESERDRMIKPVVIVDGEYLDVVSDDNFLELVSKFPTAEERIELQSRTKEIAERRKTKSPLPAANCQPKS